MTTFIHFVKNNNGGKDYIQIDHKRELYITGNTAAHTGFINENNVI